MIETPKRHKRPTLATVASAAGVSMPTVSKVLNGRSDVSPDTRARVERVLREHQYVPPRRSPRIPATARVVDLVFNDLLNPYSTELMHGVIEAGDEAGVDVAVGRFPHRTDRGSREGAREWARRLVAADRAGIIVVTSELTIEQIAAFDEARLPLVVIDPMNLPRVDVVSVGATNWSGGFTATEHLVQLGHERIAFVGGSVRASCGQARLHGYLAALSTATIPVDPDLVCHGRFTYDTGYEQGLRLLRRAQPPTAIFAGCDPIAFGVIEAARERGLSVPTDLSVVGFDDTYTAAWSAPPLTTIRQPLQEMGRVALRTLVRLGAGQSLDSHHVELATRLIVRNSTAPPA